MSPYEYIKKEIVLGNLRPGSVFDESKFQEELKVSRTPIREAVLKLSEEGYIKILPRKGTIVSDISFKDVKEIYEYRLILEPSALLAIKKIDDQILLKWKDYFLNLKNEKENLVPPQSDTYLDDYDKAFHLTLIEMVDNLYIYKEVSYLMDLSLRVRYLSNINNKKRYLASLDEHILIIDAILNKDLKKASKLMKMHLEKSLEGYSL